MDIEETRRETVRQNEKKNFIWNMLGSGIYAVISMLLSVVVIRVMGEQIGGVFSIAVTISQMLMYIAYFEMRTFQITDIHRKYSLGQYHGAKLLLCAAMLLVSAVYIFCQGYSAEKSAIIFLMCVYRMLDGYADLYEGQFQLDGRLYLSGQAMFGRSVLSFAGFVLVLVVTRSVKTALGAAIAVSILTIWIADVAVERRYESIRPIFDWVNIKGLIVRCAPFFASAFLWVYILSASRIAIDHNMPEEFQSYYQMLFMPVSVVNLFATFFYRPALNTLTGCFQQGDSGGFMKQIAGIVLLTAGFTAVCMAGAYLLGIPVLSLMSGCDLGKYRGTLALLMAAGGLNSFSFFLYYVLTIFRRSGGVLFGYGSASVLTAVLSEYLVRRAGINGAAWSFFITVLYLGLVFLGIFWRSYKRGFGLC